MNFEFDKEVIDRWSDEDLQSPRAETFVPLLGEDKDRKLVMYCGFVKCAQSHNAAVLARKLGYANVFRYPGGGSTPGEGPVIR